jgi:hypothetical protein
VTNRSNTKTSILRRLEATPEEEEEESAFLADDDVELIVRAIAQNQESSAVCRGCQLPGHTLVDCNRFVDYIVAESLAQRHPTLRTQVANSHSHFCSRLNAATARSRLTSGTPTRTMRSLQMALPSESQADVDATAEHSTSIPTVDNEEIENGFRQNSIQIVHDAADDDFESCFAPVTIRYIELLGVDSSCPTSAETVLLPPEPSPNADMVLRHLAATYDVWASLSFAHADNGSMANTVHDSALLFAYRSSRIRKCVSSMMATMHIIHPASVSYVCPLPIVELPEPPRPFSFARITLPRFPESLFHIPLCRSNSALPVTTRRAIPIWLVSSISRIVSVVVRIFTSRSNRHPSVVVSPSRKLSLCQLRRINRHPYRPRCEFFDCAPIIALAPRRR